MAELIVLSAKESLPILIVDQNSGLELDCTLSFSARFQMEREAIPTFLHPIPSDETLQREVTSKVIIAYLTEYPHGMPKAMADIGHPDAAFVEKTKIKLNEDLGRSYGLKLNTFQIENHQLLQSDLQKWEVLLEAQRLTDPKVKAESLLQELQKKLDTAKQGKTDTDKRF